MAWINIDQEKRIRGIISGLCGLAICVSIIAYYSHSIFWSIMFTIMYVGIWVYPVEEK